MNDRLSKAPVEEAARRMSKPDIINVERIQAALNDADVEGLLAMGCPDDEYAPEARMVAEALATIATTERTEHRVVAILSAVWGQMFGCSDQGLESRRPAFQTIAQRIVNPET